MSGTTSGETNPLYVYISAVGTEVFDIEPLLNVTLPEINDQSSSRAGRVSPKTPHKVIYFRSDAIKALNQSLINCHIQESSAHISIYEARDFIAPKDSADGLNHTTQLHISMNLQMNQQQYITRIYLDDQHLIVGIVCKRFEYGREPQPVDQALQLQIKSQMQSLIHSEGMREILLGVSALIDASNTFAFHQRGEFVSVAEDSVSATGGIQQQLSLEQAKFAILLPKANFDELQEQKESVLSLYKILLEEKGISKNDKDMLLEQQELLMGFNITKAVSGKGRPGLS